MDYQKLFTLPLCREGIWDLIPPGGEAHPDNLLHTSGDRANLGVLLSHGYRRVSKGWECPGMLSHLSRLAQLGDYPSVEDQ